MRRIEREIVEIVPEVWGDLLGMRPGTAEGAPEPAPDCLTASVHVKGGWAGDVMLTVGEPLARRAAAGMFGREASELDAGQVKDALGEVANILCGHLRPVLARHSNSSLPAVGASVQSRKPDATRVVFDCDGQYLWVDVVERI